MNDPELEPERYELRERPAYRFVELSRRDFLRGLGGGLIIALLLGPREGEAGPPSGRGRRGGPELPEELGAWLKIGADESITVFTGKVEVGQGIRTSLAQVVAEQLAIAPERVAMVMGDTALTPWDRGTHGSQSTPRMGPQLRRVAATARSVLIGLAAERWKVPAGQLRLDDGAVVDGAGERRLSFGALAGDRDLTAVVEAEARADFEAPTRVVGEAIAKVRARAMVTGQHRYTSDLAPTGLLHGKVLRAPSYGATRTVVDTTAARAIEGVTVVEDGELVGVAAASLTDAERALAAITAQWSQIDQVGAKQLHEHLVATAREGGRGRGAPEQGSLDSARRQAAHTIETRYTIPYIAHAPLEPRAALASWTGDEQLEVWTGTQHPFGVRDDLAEAFGLSPERVRVRVPDTGSGYGGKHTSEVALEAARLARAAQAPVKLVWTREEEFRWAYFRPAGVMDVRAQLDDRGQLIGWEHINYNSGRSALEAPYRVANRHEQFMASDSPLRQGSYRGLASTANVFARESHIDACARAAGVDALSFRRMHLEDSRVRGVLDAAAERFGWEGARARGHGFGHAAATDKGGYVATFAEVAVDDEDRLTVVRLVTAFECGAIVNPKGLETQVEGGVIMGLGGALFEAIEFDDGVVGNARFSGYRVPRITDMPALETVLVDRRELPSAGAGEAPICCVAPAIANAIFEATGRRITSLPLTRGGVLAAADEL